MVQDSTLRPCLPRLSCSSVYRPSRALEGKIGWKRYPLLYEVRAEVGPALENRSISPADADALAAGRETARHRMFAAILKVLDDAGQRLQVMDRDNVAGLERVSFTVMATRREHDHVLSELRASGRDR